MSWMQIHSWADLLAHLSWLEVATWFAPAWLLALWAGWRLGPAAPIRSVRSPLASRRPVVGRGWIYLSVLVWALIAAVRTLQFFGDLVVSHGPDPNLFWVLALGDLGAGAVTLFSVTLGLSLRGRPAHRLGLRRARHLAVVAVLLCALADASLFLTVQALVRPAHGGLPLRLVETVWVPPDLCGLPPARGGPREPRQYIEPVVPPDPAEFDCRFLDLCDEPRAEPQSSSDSSWNR